jgi:ATP-binding cassette subfamily C (CFTR/MRP) protein 1
VLNLTVSAFNQGISSFITGWTMLETSLGAIARLRNFENENPPENEAEDVKDPLEPWPTLGEIEFDDISASYK